VHIVGLFLVDLYWFNIFLKRWQRTWENDHVGFNKLLKFCIYLKLWYALEVAEILSSTGKHLTEIVFSNDNT
jgi:hypothetical protein